MSPKLKLIVAFTLVALVGAGVAGGAVWWLSKGAAAGAAAANAAPAPEKASSGKKKPHKYITLEKVIIMLRRNPGEPAHYLSTDLVVTTTDENEKHTKEHLPLLRSIAVSSLSDYTLEKASAMSVAELAEHLNKAFNEHYEHEQAEKPFSEIMIGKLIID